ncbi:MAG: ABC transporter ATP-binding protein [Omnitrophica WOR_2 bacterium]
MHIDVEEPIVVAHNLSRSYQSRDVVVEALSGINLRFQKGRMIAIKGASGSGKTTLLNLIGAIDKPSSGSIVVDGIDVSKIHGRDEVNYRLQKVGFVFQSYYLIPNLTAMENILLPMELSGVSAAQRETRARELLQRVGLDNTHGARKPGRLSGGEQQRVAIARALANNPSIILADEPTGNLDSRTGSLIVDLLYSLTMEGRTVIVATHSADVAAKADIVLAMVDGHLINQGLGDESGVSNS